MSPVGRPLRSIATAGPMFVAVLMLAVCATLGQQPAKTPYISQEISEVDGIPVLIKHLPEWEAVYSASLITDDVEDIRQVAGDHPVLSVIEFLPGTEAVTAVYPAGRLLIVEHTSPQAATEAELKIREALLSQTDFSPAVFRRIGNYSTFVFDARDTGAADALLDHIRYEKTVQWLGEDPFLWQKLERYFANTGRDVALSTVFFIFSVFLTALVLGAVGGFLFFRFRQQKRAARTAFSDSGGLTRLNLDELSEPLRLKSQ